jgi:hypothetical protein
MDTFFNFSGNGKKLYKAKKQNKNTGINMGVKHVPVPW